jgi:hypothetical protein
MSIRSNGSYIGFSRTPTTSQDSASGIWDLRTAERQRRATAWPQPVPPFSPTDISGVQAWYDASDASTLYDATTGGSLVAADGGVARWEDKSGNGRHMTQSTSANRPARKTSQQNGRDTLLFDGTNDQMAASDFLDVNTGGITAFIVYKRNATGSLHELITKGNTNGVGWFARHLSSDKLGAYVDAGSGNASSRATSSTVDASGYIVAAMSFSAGAFQSVTFRRNGTALSMASAVTEGGSGAQTPANTTAPVRIGAQEYLGAFYFHANANIAEVLMYDSALSDTDREAVESYLMTKWGIS